MNRVELSAISHWILPLGRGRGAKMQTEENLTGVNAVSPIKMGEESQTENLIGMRIRQIRKQSQISAADLGETVGVSRSMISQIELGRSNASVAVLKSIASALGVPLFTLFVEDRSGGEIIRRSERPKLQLPGSDVIRELLVPDTHRKMTLITAVFDPGDRSSYEPSAHQGEECLVVIRGEITVHYHTDVITLAEGDSFYFDSTVPHIFANESAHEAEIIAAICS